jgi:hypothetical protein
VPDPEPLSRTVEYRGQLLVIRRLTKQWEIEITTTPTCPDPQILKGWNEDEVLKRAKMRVDGILERRNP